MDTLSKASLLLLGHIADNRTMLQIHCPDCDRQYLVGTRSILSIHNTSEGVIAYVRCPEGHTTINTGTTRSIEKIGAGAERPLQPVRKTPVGAGHSF